MKKINIFLIFIICTLGLLHGGVAYAKSPVAIFYENDNKIVVEGEYNGELNNDTITILVLKDSADYPSYSTDDVLYTASQKVKENGMYSFGFGMNYSFDDCEIYINRNGEVIKAFKTKTDVNVPEFTEAFVLPEKDVLVCGQEIVLDAKAMSYAMETKYDSCEFYTDNDVVAKVEGNVLKALKKGTTNVYAKISINGKIITSEMKKIEIRDEKSCPSLVGISFKKGEKILDVVGDLSLTDNIVFSFDAEVEKILGIKITNLTDSTERVLVGEYNNQTYSVKLNGNMGFGKFRFDVISEDLLGLSSAIEGSGISFGVEDKVVTGEEYPLSLIAFNYRDYDIPVNDVEFSGDGVLDNVFSAKSAGEYIIKAEFFMNGEKRIVYKTITAVGVDKLIPKIEKLRMEISESQQISVTVLGTDGSVLETAPTFSSSNTSKATVSSTGIIYAKARGTAKITAKCGDKSASVTIYVGVDGNRDVVGGILIESDGKIEQGEKSKIRLKQYMISGAEEEISGVVFSSSDEDVITVYENGIIEGVNSGEATITAEYNGVTYAKTIRVVKRKIISAELELDSYSIPAGAYEKVNVLVNSNEYLSGAEFELYSENSDVVKIENNYLYAVNEGVAGVYAICKIDGENVRTETVNISVFKPSGGYMIDELENADNIYYLDSRLYVKNGKVYTKGSGDNNAEFIYHVNGDINDFIIYDYICNPTYKYEDVYMYVSTDNEEYFQVTDYERIKGKQVNGWGTDILKAENISEGMRYLKIVLDNRDTSTQATQITKVEIGYSSSPEVLDVQIVDDCRGDEIYKNVFGRKAIITFNQPVNQDTLENIIIGDKRVSDVEYMPELLRCEFVINDKSEEKNNIYIKGVEEYTGKENIPLTVTAENVKNIYEVSGRKIYELNEGLQAERVLLKNDTLYPKKYIVIECKYSESGRLISAESKVSGNVDAVSEKYIYFERDLIGNNKMFIWESFETMSPLR